ncbi:MaoC/PaaZ C-terminal domain-containing protein [Rhodococcoides fascians]|uniref:MaoC/PaaZ C-terminal domain-containing protein n=1 Tax=Rhodococcoides fascians TaxID=1828 RepID=UPI00050BDC52|nr:MaoC/PaaZ C-terminal domain-containing protein [Rhodococcus fascians]
MTSSVVTISSLQVGATATRRFVVAADAVDSYANLSDDHNPIHVDAAYAASTPFARRIAHGMLVAGYVQSPLTSLVAPGGVSKSYTFELHAPTFVDAVVDATVTCTQVDPPTGRASFDLEITDIDAGTVVITGHAVVAFKRTAHTG